MPAHIHHPAHAAFVFDRHRGVVLHFERLHQGSHAPDRADGLAEQIVHQRFTSSEIPCMKSIANATMISALDGHCARPPAFPDCSLISTERRKKGIPVTTMMMV